MSADDVGLVREHYAAHARRACLPGCFACEDLPPLSEESFKEAVRNHFGLVRTVRWNSHTREGSFDLWRCTLCYTTFRAFAEEIKATDITIRPTHYAVEAGDEHCFSVDVSTT